MPTERPETTKAAFARIKRQRDSFEARMKGLEEQRDELLDERVGLDTRILELEQSCRTAGAVIRVKERRIAKLEQGYLEIKAIANCRKAEEWFEVQRLANDALAASGSEARAPAE